MAIKTFMVETYQVAAGFGLSATWGGVTIKARGYVVCSGGDHRFIAYFLADDSAVPAPTYIPPNKVGAIFLPPTEMATFVDLVRNEKPIYAYLNSDRPEWNYVRSGPEPVGEEEG